MPSILSDADLYDVVIIDGTRSPGVVTLSGHNRKVDWDIKDGPGLDGASMTRKSTKPCEFTASFYLATEEDFDAWPDFATLINSTVASATPKALPIYHPDLAAENIASVVLSEMGGFQYDRKGGATVAVKLIEYRPPKPKGGSPSGTKTNKKDPNQDLQDEIARLTNQYQNTPWGV